MEKAIFFQKFQIKNVKVFAIQVKYIKTLTSDFSFVIVTTIQNGDTAAIRAIFL